jgi:hypothetical protein
MVAAEARVETGAAVKDAAIIQILEPLERHGGALEVLEQGLELLAVALCDPAIRMDSETRILPASEQRDPLLGDLLLLEQRFEELLAEKLLQRSEVDVLGCRMEDPVAGEDAEGGEGVSVGMEASAAIRP